MRAYKVTGIVHTAYRHLICGKVAPDLSCLVHWVANVDFGDMSAASDTQLPYGYPIRYILYVISYTLYPIRYIRYVISYTIYPIRYIRYDISDTIYPIRYILYDISDTLYPIRYIRYVISDTIYPIRYIRYDISDTIYPIRYIRYDISDTIYPTPDVLVAIPKGLLVWLCRFSELNDPMEQRRRFQQQQHRKAGE
eukprot:SAG11_NODE_544_length_8629_cov_3.550229_8_plen_195_part_00